MALLRSLGLPKVVRVWLGAVKIMEELSLCTDPGHNVTVVPSPPMEHNNTIKKGSC